MKKRGFEFSFSWLFAIIAGAVIIFLAIYATINLVGSERDKEQPKAGEQLGILLNPVETNLETGKYFFVSFPDETRFHNSCKTIGNFGEQAISLEIRSDIGDEWQRSNVENSFNGKYIFSKLTEQGKELHLFVESFDFPYKVADLVFASSDNYCFISAPDEIKEEIESVGLNNINFSSGSCPRNYKKVCFSGSSCEINVDLDRKSVEKDGEIVFYEENLIYGAIFADKEIYECQINRLMKRTAELAQLYSAKTEILSGSGCSSGLSNELINYAQLSQIEDSSKLVLVAELSEELERRNDALICKLF